MENYFVGIAKKFVPQECDGGKIPQEVREISGEKWSFMYVSDFFQEEEEEEGGGGIVFESFDLLRYLQSEIREKIRVFLLRPRGDNCDFHSSEVAGDISLEEFLEDANDNFPLLRSRIASKVVSMPIPTSDESSGSSVAA